jgi:Zn-dependent protease
VLPSHQGAFRLFRLAGIDVFLHWTWFVVALIEVRARAGQYSSPVWNLAEYLALFLIVTLHEFGHSLACRQVGGTADQIVLWPLGGVAYVNPPQRPGATLWSIAAGPLVNLALVPVLIGLGFLARQLGLAATMPDVIALLRAVAYINVGLLVFNLLPVYPLDGGQILRSLLWFVLGRARSLTVASLLGFVGVLGLAGLALLARSFWIGLMAAFVGTNCWSGFQHARGLARLAKLPRHQGFACPSCHAAPPIGAYWACGQCGAPFDTFETSASCPQCRAQFAITRCVDCGVPSPIAGWASGVRPQ